MAEDQTPELRKISKSGEDMSIDGSFPMEDAKRTNMMIEAADDLDTYEHYQSLIPTNWPEEAASEQAAYVSLANNLDETTYDQVKQDLITSGRSDVASRTQSDIEKRNIEESISLANNMLSSEETTEEDRELILEAIDELLESGFNRDVADEMTMRLGENELANQLGQDGFEIADKNLVNLEEQLTYSAKIRDLIAESKDDAFSWSAGTLVDILGTLVSANDSLSYNGLVNHLDKKWSKAKLLAPGEFMKDVREYASSLDSKEQYELAVSMQEFLHKNAGIISANDVQAVTMLSDILNDHIGGDPDDFDFERWLLDVGPTLDLLSLGVFSAVRKGVTMPFKWLKNSRMNRLNAVDPDSAARYAEAAMKEEKAAEIIGETSQSLNMKGTAPKVDGWDGQPTPSATTEAILKTQDEAEVLREINILEDVISATGREAAEKEAKQLAESTKGHNLWPADTQIVGDLGGKWKVRALIGKNSKYGFATEAAARAINNIYYGGLGKILTRTTRTEGLKEVVQKGRSLQGAIDDVIDELRVAQAPKLSRGEQKALRKELRELAAEKSKILADVKPLPTGGTNAQRTALANTNKAIERKVAPLDAEINDIQSILDVSAQGARAEANISRLRQMKDGQVELVAKLDPDVRKRLDDLQADRLVQEAKPAKDKIEYFLKVEREGDITFAHDDIPVSLFGKVGSWLFDADTKLSKMLSQQGNMVFDRWKYLEKELLHYLDPVAKLPRAERIALSKLISKGDELEKTYSATEIRRILKADKVSPAMIERMTDAYKSFRQGMDVLFTLENRIFRKELERQNMKHVQVGDYNSFAEPLSRNRAMDVRTAFDPQTQRIVQVDAAQLYKNGEQIGKLRGTEIVNNQGTNYILLRNGTVNDLPVQVLKKREGWVGRTNKSNYFIVKSREIKVDGVMQTRDSTVNVAHDLTTAQRAIDELNMSAPDGVRFDFKHDRQLTSSDFTVNMQDMYANTGGLFYSKRGDRLTDMEGVKSTIRDPLEAAVAATTRISRDSTMSPYINDLKRRFIETFKNVLPEPGRFPDDINKISKSGKVADPEVVKAKAMYRHIQILDGFGQESNFRRNSIIIADYAERNFGRLGAAMAKAVRGFADSEPVSFIRAKNFELQIATNPLAQLAVQPTQTINLIALGPTTFVEDFRRGKLVSKLARKKIDLTASDEDLAGAAKSLGITVNELRADIRSFRRSGLGASITAHETARDAARPLSQMIDRGPAGQAGMVIKETFYSKPVAWVSRHGFERGEEINLGVHWQVAKRRWMKANEGKSPYTPEAEAAIQGEARSLSLSMTRPGDFAYQRGIWAIPTQYLAVQHKQLLLMIPGGSKTLSTSEKFKVMGVQLAAWGPAGLGLGAAVRSAANEAEIELTGPVEQLIMDGLIETMINNALTMITNDTVDLDLAGRFAAAGGLNDNAATAVAEMLLDNETADLWSIVLGPTMTTINRFKQAADTALMALAGDTNIDDIQNAGSKALSIISSYNNGTQAMFYRNMGWWTTPDGQPIFQPSSAELIAKGVLGIQPNRLDEFYTARRSQREYQEYINEVATDWHRNLLALTNEAIDNTQGVDSYQKTLRHLQEMTRLHGKIISMHEGDADAITRAMQNKMRTLNQNGEDNLIRAYHKLIMKNGRSGKASDIIQEGVNLGYIKQEDVDRYTEFMSTLTGETDNGR